MSFKNIIVIIIVLLLFIIGVWFSSGDDVMVEELITYNYVTESGDSLEVIYNPTTNKVKLKGLNWSDLEFDQIVSASGARYENRNEDLVLWNKGGEISLFKGDEIILTAYTNLVPQPVNELINQEWIWVSAIRGGEEINPNQTDSFSINFQSDGLIRGTTDCNSFSADYSLDGNKVILGPLASTKMFCQNSQEQVFIDLISGINNFVIEDNSLVLNSTTSSMFFQK